MVAKWTAFLITALVAAIVLLAIVSTIRAEDRGYFNCFGLTQEQKNWFASDGVKTCCDLSDGMPSYAEDRSDGIYVPPHKTAYKYAWSCKMGEVWNPDPPDGDHSDWIRVADSSVLRKSNPVGVVIVWWSNPGGENARDVRCLEILEKV
jgi:hypothetical protein